MAQSWWQLDWVWAATGWVLGVAGGVLLLWALFGDRARGRKRCPKCWYDMSGAVATARNGVEVFVCPECGRASRERRLRRTRRRWWPALGACVVLAGAFVAAREPEYRKGGWVRAVPSTFLATCAQTRFFTKSLPTALGMGASFPAGGPTPTFDEAIGEEAWRRVFAGEMWEWQSSLFVRRAVEPDRCQWEPKIAFPARWVAGVDMPLRIEEVDRARYTRWPVSLEAEVRGGTVFMMLSRVYAVKTPRTPGVDFPIVVWFTAGDRAVYKPTVDARCRLLDKVEDLFTPDVSPEMGETARTMLNPGIVVRTNGLVALELNDRGKSGAWRAVHTGMGCRIEVLVGDEPAGAAAFVPSWHEEWGLNRRTVGVVWKRKEMREAAEAHPERIRLRLHGDLGLSFESYREWPFEAERPRYWAGMVECSPSLEVEEKSSGLSPGRSAGTGKKP